MRSTGPRGTSAKDRARVQVLGLALTAFSQGVACFHAGVELLQSMSGDHNSFDGGDGFSRLDWTLQDKEPLWPALTPVLADPRPAASAQWDAQAASLTVPSRTALVYVMPRMAPPVLRREIAGFNARRALARRP